ncbi:hypothetical protein Tco_0738869 [Tanacetum coccineum]
MTQSLVAEKIDISENKASRNFDLMIKKWCLLKITLQAPSKAEFQVLFLSKQDSYITTRVGITIPPSHSNAEDNRFTAVYQESLRKNWDFAEHPSDTISIHNEDGNPA